MTEQEHRDEIVKIGYEMAKKGYCHSATGNLSVRLEDSTILASPTGCSLGNLTAADLSHIKNDGTGISGGKPTKEIPFHLSIYKSDPQCNAVIHLHTTYAVLVASLQNPATYLRPITPYLILKVGTVGCISYHKPGSPLLGSEMEQQPEAHAYLLQNHGLVAKGQTLTEALQRAEELEESCKIAVLGAQLPVRYLSQKEIEELQR